MSTSNQSQRSPYKLIRLKHDTVIASFDCDNKKLNDFILSEAKKQLHFLLSVTYLLINKKNKKTIAYFTVQNDALNLSANNVSTFRSVIKSKGRKCDNLSYACDTILNKQIFPAVKINRIAVAKEYQNKTYGTQLLNFIKGWFINNNKTGCVFITVDAINNDDVIRFYTNNNFEFAKDTDTDKESRLMYFNLLKIS